MADGILDSLVLVQVTMNITLFKGVSRVARAHWGASWVA